MSKTLDSNSRRDGSRMPGQLSRTPAAGCCGPSAPTTGAWARAGAGESADAGAAIAAREPGTVGVWAAKFAQRRRRLPAAGVVELSANDAWVRDTGPTFVVNDRGGVRGVDWRFNAWGGLQGGLTSRGSRRGRGAEEHRDRGLRRYRAPFVLEGGSIHVDGQGTLITTEECLLNESQPGAVASRSRDPAQALPDVEVIIWLGKGVHLDETTGMSTTSAPTCGRQKSC